MCFLTHLSFFLVSILFVFFLRCPHASLSHVSPSDELMHEIQAYVGTWAQVCQHNNPNTPKKDVPLQLSIFRHGILEIASHWIPRLMSIMSYPKVRALLQTSKPKISGRQSGVRSKPKQQFPPGDYRHPPTQIHRGGGGTARPSYSGPRGAVRLASRAKKPVPPQQKKKSYR